MIIRTDGNIEHLDRLQARLLGSTFMSGAAGDAGAGGGSVAPPAAAAAPPAATSLMSEAKPAVDPAAVVAETPEAKATREAAEVAAAAKAKEPPANETPEQKTAREKAEGDAAVAAKAEAMKPYDALKLPEGLPADQPAFVDFKNVAAEAKLAPDVAQRLVDTVAPKLKEAIEAPYKQWAETQAGWIKDCKEDSEYGGSNYDKSIGLVAKAIDAMPNADKLREVLAVTGAGNNPEMVRAFVHIGKMLAEGSPVLSRSAGQQKDLAAKMYPTMANGA